MKAIITFDCLMIFFFRSTFRKLEKFKFLKNQTPACCVRVVEKRIMIVIEVKNEKWCAPDRYILHCGCIVQIL